MRTSHTPCCRVPSSLGLLSAHVSLEWFCQQECVSTFPCKCWAGLPRVCLVSDPCLPGVRGSQLTADGAQGHNSHSNKTQVLARGPRGTPDATVHGRVAGALLQGPRPTSVSCGKNLLNASGKKRGGGVEFRIALTIKAAFEGKVKFIQQGMPRCDSSCFLSRIETTRKWK